MDAKDLHKTANELLTPGKGILAADESNSTAGERLASAGLDENTPENRRRYRNLFLNTDSIEDYLSGVILFTETLTQVTDDGVPFPKTLENKGILPGVKVDLGKVDFNGFPGEKITEGLDGLAKRLKTYRKQGARFTKWRAVFQISEDTPTPECIHTNAIKLARYARIAQDEGFVPIIEPEVLYAGGPADHSFQKAEEVTRHVLERVCYQLERYRVDLAGAVIKSSMVLPGKESGQDVSDKEVGQATARVLKEALSPDLAGVVFLSGGQEPAEATAHLNAIAKREPLPFEIAFSYGRAIQGPALDIWQGKEENVEKAREVLIDRLKANTAADKAQLDQYKNE
jgi:fructose-bisphosphate aldolase class I